MDLLSRRLRRVRAAYQDNFARYDEVGSALCVKVGGQNCCGFIRGAICQNGLAHLDQKNVGERLVHDERYRRHLLCHAG